MKQEYRDKEKEIRLISTFPHHIDELEEKEIKNRKMHIYEFRLFSSIKDFKIKKINILEDNDAEDKEVIELLNKNKIRNQRIS